MELAMVELTNGSVHLANYQGSYASDIAVRVKMRLQHNNYDHYLSLF